VKYGIEKGYKHGWSSNQYREKFGVWPNKINAHAISEYPESFRSWIKHQAIKRQYSRG